MKPEHRQDQEPPRIGSGDWLDSRFATHENKFRKMLDISGYVVQDDDMKTNNELVAVVKSLGFASVEAFKKYMKSKAKDHGYDSFGHVEKRDGLELSYWTHCKRQFGIGGNLGGMFCDNRFN